MKFILLSGGSGKRLWPLSNDARSKQFIKVLKDENRRPESMVQRVWRQLTALQMQRNAFIATNRSQVEVLRSQLGMDIPLIVEPERRNTFPAIALASLFLLDMEQTDPETTICVLPVDPFVDTSFFLSVTQLEDILADSKADIGLIGVRPTYPSEKYGYIVPHNQLEKKEYTTVVNFIEKPSEPEAIELIKGGALWNCGVFSFKLRYILQLLKNRGIPLQYKLVVENYFNLPSISFDYEIVEKAKSIVVIPYEGQWKDLGTWNTMTEEITETVIGRGRLDADCQNTHIINELDIPIAVLGLSNIVVAASPDGILVSDKKSSPKLKETIGDLDQRTMYEERLWGWYRILDFTKNDEGNEVLTKRLRIYCGKNLSYQIHQERLEVWTVISGLGECLIDGKLEQIGPGHIQNITPGTRHAIRAITELEIIEVQIGSALVEEDVYREELEWNNILQHVDGYIKIGNDGE